MSIYIFRDYNWVGFKRIHEFPDDKKVKKEIRPRLVNSEALATYYTCIRVCSMGRRSLSF